jgi:hypothetical protein
MIWWPFSRLDRVRDARMANKTKYAKSIAQSFEKGIPECTEKELREKLERRILIVKYHATFKSYD